MIVITHFCREFYQIPIHNGCSKGLVPVQASLYHFPMNRLVHSEVILVASVQNAISEGGSGTHLHRTNHVGLGRIRGTQASNIEKNEKGIKIKSSQILNRSPYYTWTHISLDFVSGYMVHHLVFTMHTTLYTKHMSFPLDQSMKFPMSLGCRTENTLPLWRSPWSSTMYREGPWRGAVSPSS